MNNEKIIQIIPAPATMRYGFDGGTAQPVICLALVELSSGEREVHAMGLTNGEIIEDVTEFGAILLTD